MIYLVGAAWLPLGLHAVDRWVRLGRRWGIFELALVLAMQVLGGDPQAAYLLGLAGAGYALGLAWSRGLAGRTQTARRSARLGPDLESWLVLGRDRGRCALVGRDGRAGHLAAEAASAASRRRSTPPLAGCPGCRGRRRGVGALAGVGFLYFYYWRRRGWRRPLGAMWLGWCGSGARGGVTAAQLLPVVEFIAADDQAAQRSRTASMPFSVEPYRLAELAWPNIGGHPIRREQLLARRDPDTRRVSQDVGTVALPGGMTVVLASAPSRCGTDRPGGCGCR